MMLLDPILLLGSILQNFDSISECDSGHCPIPAVKVFHAGLSLKMAAIPTESRIFPVRPSIIREFLHHEKCV